jgi:hypothetical protein
MDPDTHQDQRDGDLAGSAWGGSSGRLWFPRPRLHAAEGIDDDLDDTLSPEDHIEALQAADASPLPPVAANSAYQQAIGR